MKPLLLGMLLLLGGCSAADKPSAADPGTVGGDINSATGQAWLDNTLKKGQLWSVAGFHPNWVKGSMEQKGSLLTGDIPDLVGDGSYKFLGAPSSTTAFYLTPNIKEAAGVNIQPRLQGFFVSNVADQGSSNKIFIFQAALKLSAAQTNAVKKQVGIPDGTQVESASPELQNKYNAIVHVPANYDLTKAVVSNGATVIPVSIIVLP